MTDQCEVVKALSDREQQILEGMAYGMTNPMIGRELFLSMDTVKTHARHIYAKLGARDRAHAVAIGFRTGLLGRTSRTVNRARDRVDR